MITMDQLRRLCQDDTIVFTQHLTSRCDERGIVYESVKSCILNGEIIEQYPDDYPYPSCLMLHQLDNRKHLHVVVGLGDSRLWIITTYYPDEREWERDYKTRKVAI